MKKYTVRVLYPDGKTRDHPAFAADFHFAVSDSHGKFVMDKGLVILAVWETGKIKIQQN